MLELDVDDVDVDDVLLVEVVDVLVLDVADVLVLDVDEVDVLVDVDVDVELELVELLVENELSDALLSDWLVSEDVEELDDIFISGYIYF